MKKIVFAIMLLLSSVIIFACNKSSGSDSDTDYVDPGNWGGYTIPNKSHNLTGFTACPADPGCLAIIYQGKLSDTKYVGIAVDDGADKLKIYWQASSIPLGANNIPSCTVMVNTTPTNNVTVPVNITDNGNGTYHILFTGAVTGTTINNGDTIDAYKYPQ